MFHHHQFKLRETVPPPSSARSYELTANQEWAHHRFTLRCYGPGVSTLGEGNPNFFNDREAADLAGCRWVLTGVSPARQAPLSC